MDIKGKLAKILKALSAAVYFIGAAITLALVSVNVFGSSQPVFPEAMIPFSWREEAFVWLVLGMLPMLVACFAFWRWGGFRDRPGGKRRAFLVFLPGLVCLGYALVAVGFMIVAYAKIIIRAGA